MTQKPYKMSRMMRMLMAIGPRFAIGSMTVTLPDGEVHKFEGRQPGPDAHFTIHNDRVANRFLTSGALGFCESYMDGDWSSPDIPTLYEFFLLNEDYMRDHFNGKWWFRAISYVMHLLRPNSKSGSKKNISYHYDLGNAFYDKWLDGTMTYSAAIYEREDEELETAQRRKYQALVDKLGIKPDYHVLEIGCGWGGFAEYVASEVGARVTAITISQEQFDYATARMKKAGLQDKVDIRFQDYRDVEGQFDCIASIEMFEAVGKEYWPVFFKTIRSRLKSGGTAALQIITIEDKRFDIYKRGADYIQKYIFPGGMLPSPSRLEDEISKAKLRWQECTSFGRDYARTLLDWDDRFQKAWPSIQPMGFDDRFKRMWEQYFYYCAAGFQVGTIDVVQVSISKD